MGIAGSTRFRRFQKKPARIGPSPSDTDPRTYVNNKIRDKLVDWPESAGVMSHRYLNDRHICILDAFAAMGKIREVIKRIDLIWKISPRVNWIGFGSTWNGSSETCKSNDNTLQTWKMALVISDRWRWVLRQTQTQKKRPMGVVIWFPRRAKRHTFHSPPQLRRRRATLAAKGSAFEARKRRSAMTPGGESVAKPGHRVAEYGIESFGKLEYESWVRKKLIIVFIWWNKKIYIYTLFIWWNKKMGDSKQI